MISTMIIWAVEEKSRGYKQQRLDSGIDGCKLYLSNIYIYKTYILLTYYYSAFHQSQKQLADYASQ